MSGMPSVLVVDDSQGICQTMYMILRRKGFDVECVNDGQGAVEKVRQRPFDVILMDIRLPGMDGVEAFERIKDVRPGVRVAMMTAYSVGDKVKKALEEGAETVFYKPLEMDTIISYIRGDTTPEAPHGPVGENTGKDADRPRSKKGGNGRDTNGDGRLNHICDRADPACGRGMREPEGGDAPPMPWGG